MYLSIYLTKAAYSTLSGYTSTESWNHHLPPRLGSWPGPLFRHKIHVLARCLPVPVRRRWFNSLSGTIGGLARVIGVCSRHNPGSSRIFFSFFRDFRDICKFYFGTVRTEGIKSEICQTQTYWTRVFEGTANARFTTVPFVWCQYIMLKTDNFQLKFLCKSELSAFLQHENIIELSELNTFKLKKQQYLPHYL